MATLKNDFCHISDLKNEACVESWFVDPLLASLGWQPADISLKTAIREFKVGKGSQSALYKPDYILKASGIPAVVIDAKAPTVQIEDFEYQCSSYCLEINKAFDYNPVQFFVLSNGLTTLVYKWDIKKPLLTLDFADFVNGSSPYKEFKSLLRKSSIVNASRALKSGADDSPFEFSKISLEALGNTFRKLHQYVWTKEKKSPSAAFEELMKVIFVKIEKDKQLYLTLGAEPKPKHKDVVFSTHWIVSQTENDSPVNDPLFRNLVHDLEKQIQNGTKKRIFEKTERINLSADTVRWIVRQIEHIDFVGMEEDIHGRMFESFLDATVRGRALGQFFTPRDIVTLMVRLANIRSEKGQIDTVLDACCGSGGFLITAMETMIDAAKAVAGLTNHQRTAFVDRVRNESVFGVDAGSDPPIYRIARMNMYLHGDGGSHIYFGDALDKTLGDVGPADIEEQKQLEELRLLVIGGGKRFDVILSNPPFSLKYSREDPYQAEILSQYSSALVKSKSKFLKSLLSSVMFLERYHDLVSEDGRILAIIDESVLSGESYSHIRDYIRSRFIIIGVVSLPGDAFRRAAARVKTSVLILRKRQPGEEQGDVFMTTTTVIGVEEKVARRIGIATKGLAGARLAEIERVTDDFAKFKAGKAGPYVVSASSLLDRLDVKYCIGDRGRKRAVWVKNGIQPTTVGAVLDVAAKRARKVAASDAYQFLRVTYGGDVVDGDLMEGEDCSYSVLYEVEPWDILFSNINVGRGAIGIVPQFHQGKFVSNEYTILRARTKEEAVFYASLLRSKEILGDILAASTGMGRGRIRWPNIRDVTVPEYTGSADIAETVTGLEELWVAHATFEKRKATHIARVAAALEVDGTDAHKRWLGFKPPE